MIGAACEKYACCAVKKAGLYSACCAHYRHHSSGQNKNPAGNRTTSAASMVSLTVKADKDFLIQNSNDQFPELAKLLQSELKKRKEKAEKKK